MNANMYDEDMSMQKPLTGKARMRNLTKQSTQKLLANKGFLALWLQPFAVFFVSMMLWTYGFMDRSSSCVLVTMFGCIGSILMMMSTRADRGGSDFVNPSMGAACLMAFVLGAAIGLYNYDQYQIFPAFYERAGQYSNVVPSQSSASVADAGKLIFSSEAFPAQEQSIGFVRETGTVYCVAPIRDGSGIQRIQFWAAGIGCCAQKGEFSCDASGDSGAHAGIVIFDNNGYFQEARRDYYDKARKKAEAEFGLQSVSEPIFVRWVATKDLDMLSSSYGAMATFLVFMWTVLYAGFSAGVAYSLHSPRVPP